VPNHAEPVSMGVNAAVAEHYGRPAGSFTAAPTTLDYLVGATAACLSGTFGAGLAHIGQSITDGRLEARAEGVVENDGGVMVVRSIRVEYRVRIDDGVDPERVRKVHAGHVRRCPIAHTIGGSVPITTGLTIVGAGVSGRV
jgi:uncharacterized OsmC-like protein